LYWKFVLRADIAFAVSLAACTILFWLAVATVDRAPPWLGGLAIFAACMGALYGAADVAEDLKLIAMLRDPQKIIDSAQATAANFLTRLKFATILVSVVGVLFFIVLSVVNKVTPGLFGIFRVSCDRIGGAPRAASRMAAERLAPVDRADAGRYSRRPANGRERSGEGTRS
jgi:hypothetical protein